MQSVLVKLELSSLNIWNIKQDNNNCLEENWIYEKVCETYWVWVKVSHKKLAKILFCYFCAHLEKAKLGEREGYLDGECWKEFCGQLKPESSKKIALSLSRQVFHSIKSYVSNTFWEKSTEYRLLWKQQICIQSPLL